MPLEKFLISPPFGAYLHFAGATSVLGSYTWNPRPGRISKIVRTLRPVPGGWVNAIGLRNPGIHSIRTFSPNFVYSIAGIVSGDWQRIADYLTGNFPLMIELNLSCPNVHEYGIKREEIQAFSAGGSIVIAKLPPTENAFKLASHCAEAGVRLFHCSNTYPTPIGGISGPALRVINLPVVERMAKLDVGDIIAGGGIRTLQDVMDYSNAGATRFSVATGAFHPIRIKRLIAVARYAS